MDQDNRQGSKICIENVKSAAESNIIAITDNPSITINNINSDQEINLTVIDSNTSAETIAATAHLVQTSSSSISNNKNDIDTRQSSISVIAINSNVSMHGKHLSKSKQLLEKENILKLQFIQEKIKNNYKTKYKNINRPYLGFTGKKFSPLPMESCFINVAIVDKTQPINQDIKQLGSQPNDYNSQLYSCFEDVYKTKNKIVIKPEEFFLNNKDKKFKRLLCIGRAGIGKSTLSEYLSYRWATNKLWNDKFDLVFTIKLRNLTKSNYVSNADESNIYYQECVSEIHDNHKNNLKILQQILAEIPKEKILLILDGYDEFDTQSSWKRVIEKICETPNLNLLIMTRPFVELDYNDFDEVLECIGFTNGNIEKFVQNGNICPIKSTQDEILNFLLNNSFVYSLAHIPLLADIICATWDKDLVKQQEMTMTQFYERLIDKLWQHYNERFKKTQLSIKVKKLVKKTNEIESFLQLLAFRATEKNQILLDAELIEEVIIELYKCEEYNAKLYLKDLVSYGFLYTSDDDKYYFPHLTFQEFFAAKYIRNWLQKSFEPANDKGSLQNFFIDNKHNPRFETVWKFVAGLSKNDKKLIQKLLNYFESTPKELISFNEILLIINCLNEADVMFYLQSNQELHNKVIFWLNLFFSPTYWCQVVDRKVFSINLYMNFIDKIKYCHFFMTHNIIAEFIKNIFNKQEDIEFIKQYLLPDLNITIELFPKSPSVSTVEKLNIQPLSKNFYNSSLVKNTNNRQNKINLNKILVLKSIEISKWEYNNKSSSRQIQNQDDIFGLLNFLRQEELSEKDINGALAWIHKFNLKKCNYKILKILLILLSDKRNEIPTKISNVIINLEMIDEKSILLLEQAVRHSNLYVIIHVAIILLKVDSVKYYETIKIIANAWSEINKQFLKLRSNFLSILESANINLACLLKDINNIQFLTYILEHSASYLTNTKLSSLVEWYLKSLDPTYIPFIVEKAFISGLSFFIQDSNIKIYEDSQLIHFNFSEQKFAFENLTAFLTEWVEAKFNIDLLKRRLGGAYCQKFGSITGEDLYYAYLNNDLNLFSLSEVLVLKYFGAIREEKETIKNDQNNLITTPIVSEPEKTKISINREILSAKIINNLPPNFKAKKFEDDASEKTVLAEPFFCNLDFVKQSEDIATIPENYILALSPPDGTCLFYSVVLSSLLRHSNCDINDNLQFLELDQACRRLFSGNTNETELSVEVVKSIPDILRSHDGTTNFNSLIKGKDATLQALVEKNLRKRLFQYMVNNAASLIQRKEVSLLPQLQAIDENEIRQSANEIAFANKWGQLIHVLALSEMLKTCIIIYKGRDVAADAMPQESIVLGSEYKDQNPIIYLLFTGSHYDFFIDPAHIPNTKNLLENQDNIVTNNIYSELNKPLSQSFFNEKKSFSELNKEKKTSTSAKKDTSGYCGLKRGFFR